MTTITRYSQHLPKAIACCLLIMPCHAAKNTIDVNITFKTSRTGDKNIIQVPPTATVRDLKQKIKDTWKMQRAQQALLFKGNFLENNKTLASYTIQNQSNITLIKLDTYTFPFRIRHKGQIFNITAKNNTQAIKKAIFDAKGYPVHTQQLCTDARQMNDAPFETFSIDEDKTILGLTLTSDKPASSRQNTQPKTISFKAEILSQKGNTNIDITMDPSATIADLKKEIKKQRNIDIPNQKLAFKGKELNDNQTLDACKIQNNTKVFVAVVRKPIFHITVNIEGGTTWKDIPIYQNTTIQRIKKHIQKKKGHPVDKQILHNNKGQELKDPQQHYSAAKIDQNTTLQLTLKPNKPASNSKNTQQDTIRLKIKYIRGGNKEIYVDVPKNGKIKDVKQAILRKDKLPTINQNLHYGRDKRENETTLASCGITQNNTKIDLEVRTLDHQKMYVQHNNTTFEVRISETPKTNVLDIKEKIFCTKNYPVEDQTLLIDGLLLDDAQTLGNYTIRQGTTLQLTLTSDKSTGSSKNTQPKNKLLFNIHVKEKSSGWSGIHVLDNTTIRDIKTYIFKQEGYPIDKQQLFNQNQELKDDQQRVIDANIQPNATLRLTLKQDQSSPSGIGQQQKKLRLTIFTFLHTKIIMDVPRDITIPQLKQEIENRAGISVAQQELMHYSTKLEDYKNLDDYPIHNNAMLELRMLTRYLFNIHIKAGNETWSDIPIYSNTTIEHIKESIERDKGYPVFQQNLLNQGQPLQGQQLVTAAGIQANTTLELALDTPLTPLQNNNNNNQNNNNDNDIDLNNPTLSERAQKFAPYGIALCALGLFYLLYTNNQDDTFHTAKSHKKSTKTSKPRKKPTKAPRSRRRRTTRNA